jgi:hypothetical protein
MKYPSFSLPQEVELSCDVHNFLVGDVKMGRGKRQKM